MFQLHTNSNGQGSDDESNALGDGLLNTTTSTTSNSTSMASSSERYGRLWRRSITVGILITIKKTSNDPGEDPLQSPTSSSPLLNHDTEPNSSQQVTSDANNPVQENGFFNFVSKAYSSFSSSKSFKDQETSAPSYDPVPSSPVDEGLVSNLSIRSQHVIDIPSVNENEVVRIVKERDLNSLNNFGGVEKVASIFNSHLDKGIECIPDPQVWDTDNPVQAKGFFYFFLKAGNNYTIFLLLVSAGLSFSTEILKKGPEYGWQDGAVILAAVSMIVTFSSVAGFCQERKLKKKIWKEKNKLKVKVVRSGLDDRITISNLVPGDIVRLEKGDRVPADGLVVSGDIVLDGVLNSKIDREQNPFIHSGSKVMEGEGNMLVTSVGANTTLGKLLNLMIQDPNKKTLLEAQIAKPNAYIENLSLVVSILIALVAFIRLLFGKYHGDDDGFPELKGNVSVNALMQIFEGILFKPRGKISILASALTVAVISIQHGMPYVITVSLSCWSDEVKNQAEPQNLSACATMGIVTVMCIDVTGELVCKDLEVNKFWIGEKDLNNDVDSEIDQAVIEALERGIRAPLLVPAISASTTNGSFISWANSRWGMNVELLDQNLHVLGYRKLSSNDKCCGILMKHMGDEEKIMHTHWSGAASTILDMCSHYYDSNGRSRAIKDIKSRFELAIKDMEGSGLRPIAFACRKTEVQEIQEDGLHLLALAGIKYPEEIKSAVEAFRNAGVSIKLVSEDKLSAVRAIACELGIPESDDLALEGEQIRDLSITERMQKVDQVTLMGSCLAEDKLLLVQSMQQKDHIVAFVGGSSSIDSPALKEADVGITVANWCTKMARESSDIVIWAPGSLSMILKNGRCVYHNIQKFSELQLTVCISGLLITLITTMILEDSPITTVQLIWVNGITCILGGLMMVMELQVEELIANPPAERTSSLLTKVMCKSIALQVLCQASVLLIFQFKGQVIPSMNRDVRKAMIFSSFTLSQVANLFYAMNMVKKEVLLSVLRNTWFLMAYVTVIVVQVLVAEFLKSLADCVRLNWIQWIVCFLLAALPCSIHIAVEFISHSLLNRSLWSDGLQTVLSSRRWPHHRPYLLCIGIPFSMFLLFSDVAGHFAMV
ncbi:hypothetical protein LWI29_030587 [Acer saccharum]|uniref:Calcium-transporting ATPase n=1 Tax=Acer saccharum TaxID=4024 RepID=A0AA39SFE0_ACESA|nr:hypothetical protein LWI29_030587 [Acer saccharum]